MPARGAARQSSALYSQSSAPSNSPLSYPDLYTAGCCLSFLPLCLHFLGTRKTLLPNPDFLPPVGPISLLPSPLPSLSVYSSQCQETHSNMNPPMATLSRISEAFTSRQHRAITRDSNRVQGTSIYPIKTRPDISTRIYNHPSVKAYSIATKIICLY